jgi:hypothetical protein
MKTYTNGDKFKVVITLDAELVTDLKSVTDDDLVNMVFKDEAYGLKSIIVGTVDANSGDNHDTEIV